MGTKTAINRIDLGYTRIAGWNLFDEITKEFQETTPKEVKDLINHGQVNGLKLNNGLIELDIEGFNMRNILVKSAVGKFRPLYPTTSMVNCMYAVVRVIETDTGRQYEIISNKCARVKVTSEHLKIIMEIGYVAGVKMGTNGEIEICEGVSIEDKRSSKELSQNIVHIEVKETERSLHDIHIEQEQDSSVEADEKAVEKSAESVDDETINPVEQDANGSDIVFDSLEASEVNDDNNITSDDTSINIDNAEGNNGENPSQEQVEDNKKTATRKTRKK